jgi:hypothetical protein
MTILLISLGVLLVIFIIILVLNNIDEENTKYGITDISARHSSIGDYKRVPVKVKLIEEYEDEVIVKVVSLLTNNLLSYQESYVRSSNGYA